VELFKNNRVWLFLDGVDEIAGDSVSVGARHVVPLQMVASQLEGWVAKARVVLTCRLNVWEANINALGDDFETYRLLDFDYPLQVKEFICRWFRKTDPDKGERLWAELDKSERQRIQDLVKNPLRLALLCSTYDPPNPPYQGGSKDSLSPPPYQGGARGGSSGLPSTEAGLYQRFVEVFYTWKKNRFRTTFEQRQELNAALGRLALTAIDSEESRFRLRHKVVCEVLGDPEQENSLFGLALQLGWLNQVGLAAESETQETVYAFFHPTFQEYFAALAIDDWRYFLNHVPDNPAQGIYRIFEPQWKEVIFLWLGRPHEEVEKEQKEEFIKKLVEFEDGCGEFYRTISQYLVFSYLCSSHLNSIDIDEFINNFSDPSIRETLHKFINFSFYEAACMFSPSSLVFNLMSSSPFNVTKFYFSVPEIWWIGKYLSQDLGNLGKYRSASIITSSYIKNSIEYLSNKEMSACI
jgi:predicted NACHT family NTPase